MIFAPTRELCIQIEMSLHKCLQRLKFIVAGSLMGGESVKKEKSRIRKGLNIIVCTPGRLLYHLKNTTSLSFKNLKYLIFDEADRILDLGFEREMKECLDFIKSKNRSIYIDQKTYQTNPSVHVALVSATLGRKIDALSKMIMVGEKRVGFDMETTNEELDLATVIPKSIS